MQRAQEGAEEYPAGLLDDAWEVENADLDRLPARSLQGVRKGAQIIFYTPGDPSYEWRVGKVQALYEGSQAVRVQVQADKNA